MLLAFLRRDLREEVARPAGALLQLGGTVVQALFWALLGRALEPGRAGYFAFVAVGGAVLNALHGPLYGLAAGLARERQLGTLDFLLQSRRPVAQWAAGFLAWPTVWSAGLTVLYLAVMAALGLPISAAGALPLALTLLCALPVYWGAALLCGAWTLRFRRGQPLAWVMGAGSMLVGGVFILVDRLPRWAAPLAPLAPTYQPARMARIALAEGRLDGGGALWLLGAGALALMAGWLALAWAVSWLRASGDLSAD